MLKIAIIADDLTGANDCAVRLTAKGCRPFIMIRPVDGADASSFPSAAVTGGGPSVDARFPQLVIDTDSRASRAEEAYAKVKEAAEFVKRSGFSFVYKKIDSTFRGNTGREIDALYDVYRPDFVVIAPAYPKHGRQVMDGKLYMHGLPLHETEIARDPKTPVTISDIPALLRSQTTRSVGLLTRSELHEADFRLNDRLSRFRSENTPYLVFDSLDDDDLRRIVEGVNNSGYSVVWAGSAGLIGQLPAEEGNDEEIRLAVTHGEATILVVVGSVSPRSRKQLEVLLRQPDVLPLEMRSHVLAVGQRSGKREMERVLRKAEALHARFRTIVLYTTGHPEDVRLAQAAGRNCGLDHKKTSDNIAAALGETVAALRQFVPVGGYVLTGGDTARQVCDRIGAEWMEIVGEVEEGIPIGRLSVGGVAAVTKAGSFGSDDALWNAVRTLRGEVLV
ncbi:four-carbon acid sugar kinase family protein [Paenibacillus cisolokensis]|uniref:four-carbon acid sugar kinase family protein n=1 Tax=Paenibacillus cisolokensis TaxID=1658519 RepID=UPI003D27EA47